MVWRERFTGTGPKLFWVRLNARVHSAAPCREELVAACILAVGALHDAFPCTFTKNNVGTSDASVAGGTKKKNKKKLNKKTAKPKFPSL